MSVLIDNYARQFSYLRLSITDICNFRCAYCLPNGYCKSAKAYLSLPEIKRLLTAFSELGMKKVRLTGGEPTLRQDFLTIAKLLSQISSITTRAFTTNGYRLREFAKAYAEAGLTHINVSVDSLDAKKFHQITGHDRLAEVLEGIKQARAVGFQSIKINTVLLKDVTLPEIESFLAWVKKEALTIRFIELMETGETQTYFSQHHLSATPLKERLCNEGWQIKPRAPHSGPAQIYFHPEYKGNIGIIAPYEKDFCNTCNRLRVSSTGNLHLCLFGDIHYPLRNLLHSDEQKEALKAHIVKLLTHKHATHLLHQGNFGATPHLASIGG